MDDPEIDAGRGIELAGRGRRFYVFMNSLGDLELAREALGAGSRMEGIDMGEARTIMFMHGDRKSLREMAGKYEGAVIVCPHGRTSLEFARALSELGVKAYSLKGGIEGLRQRS